MLWRYNLKFVALFFFVLSYSDTDPSMGTFSIQEQHAYVRLLESGYKSALTVDEQQADHFEEAEIVEEG